MSNVLHVNIIEAKDIEKMDTIGNSDPYVILQLGNGPEFKTTVKKNTLTPVWKEQFSLPITDMTGNLKLLMKDKDVAADDKMATLEISLNSLKYNEVVDQWYPMAPIKKGKKGGQIHLQLHFCDAKEKPFKGKK